ncbi:TRAF3-interacting protein 1 [Teleopsis dalmanni]|uniref:TRAF3-interacting protein 1 n=1 Tax=Teleopsis dalmanni TaxID=139649 RepID=UPI0018CE3C9E|nr:TRAF3-interacting protein 1 [Teleopsis dalmanni]
MAESNIDPTVIKLTQDTLGKYVKKPPLSEKLLKKPPFRFLFDIFTVVIRDTGCFEGLYTAEELTFENIKDRDDKMKFLQKMIDVVKLTTNDSLTVRTSKIVAGHEPEKTNELLQLMGQVIENKLDWKNAMNKLSSGTPDNKEIVTKDSKQKDSKIKEKIKDKNAKTKEMKIKESKTGTKAISTTTNDGKIKKPLVVSKEKEKNTKDKTTIRDNREKDITKKMNETTEKSSKKIKTKTEQSPSPNKDEIKQKAKVAKVVQQSSIDKKIDEEIKNKISPIKKVDSPVKNIKAEETISTVVKQNSSPQHSTENDISLPQELKKSSETEQLNLTPSKESGSRKSSAKLSNDTPTKSRRSSATKMTKIEISNHVQQNDIQSLDSLSTLNEVETSLNSKAIKSTESVATKVQPTAATETPSPINKTEYKRESTFVRENSKDSTNSVNATNRPRTSLRPPSARPASARPGAPRRRDKNIEIVLQPNDQINISGINVKLETFNDVYDDGENLVIIEDPNAEHINGFNLSDRTENQTEELAQPGHLVQQILETQKELVQQNVNDITNKTEKETGYTNGLNARQSSARQMNNLREVIQNLAKSVSPLGKLMDLIPEDIDAMQLELVMWRDTYVQAAADLRRERSLTTSMTEPMKNQLVEIDGNIKEYIEMIKSSRAKILQNGDKIIKMLTEQ